ncbi:hypothetical protein BCR36DRAFT_158771, partial [Piromyces finnis]
MNLLIFVLLIMIIGYALFFFFLAIRRNNFKIANYLLKEGVDINFSGNSIISHLNRLDLLNNKNLNYILNHGFTIKDINPDLIEDFSNNSKIDFLEIIFNHFIYTNSFILYLLKLYKNKTPRNDWICKKNNNVIYKWKHKVIYKKKKK